MMWWRGGGGCCVSRVYDVRQVYASEGEVQVFVFYDTIQQRGWAVSEWRVYYLNVIFYKVECTTEQRVECVNNCECCAVYRQLSVTLDYNFRI